MLFNSEKFLNSPVMSLQTGSELARTSKAIIDPRDLTIVAYELEGRMLDRSPSLLMIRDIREIGPLGMIIDSTDELVAPGDVINLKKVYEYQFKLLDKPVIDEDKRKVGKVIGYTLESSSFVIQQLQIKRPLLKSFGDTELLVHRSQIVKITDEEIIIKSASVHHKVEQTEPKPIASYDNPFRKQPQPESADRS
ncbi:hypothetical protein CR969_00420 [Candidatus Saccharibacteria bacterium]|nr:MAG: hypothetical protein CR969_00420 [Candidatus Saccharibacteria bacterium]